MNDATSLKEARDWLRSRADRGERCPCCRQYVKVYRRKLNAGMAAWLIRFYRATRFEPEAYHHFSLVQRGSGDWTTLRHWALIEANPDAAGGEWRITRMGIAFVRDECRVASHAVLYDDRCLRLEGDAVRVRDALGKRFDYAELMGQRPQSDEPE